MLREFNFLRKLGKFRANHFLKLNFYVGDGSFGTVYLVRRISDGQLYALKKVSIFYLYPIIFLLFRDFSDANNAILMKIGQNDWPKRQGQAKCLERDQAISLREVSQQNPFA